jgi:uncharacterized protein YndB with AHSA1/START domain
MFSIPINPTAPVVEKQSVVIQAQPRAVWKALTDISDWPNWQQNITHARMDGPLKAGTTFHWKADGIAFVSVIHTCNEPLFFGWTGKTVGAAAVHNWILKPHAEGTEVFVEECLTGFLPSLFKRFFSKNLKVGMHKSLTALKAFSEG